MFLRSIWLVGAHISAVALETATSGFDERVQLAFEQSERS